jgi:23S rRNA pseudouridine2605 synthase
VRLNQFLASAGFGSRRSCEKLIEEGRVSINGKIVTQLATRVSPDDSVAVNHKKIHREKSLTVLLHKPAGYLCTTTETEGRTIYELLPRGWPRLSYVGRLDKESEGLLLLTNDGELNQRLTHPTYKLPKIYEVILDREFDFSLADKLKKGLIVEGKKGRFDAIYRLGRTGIKVVLTQGIKRQIRLMLEMVGYRVKKLVRTEMGGLKLGSLPAGQWRILSEKEIERCFKNEGIGPEKKRDQR